MKKYIFYFIIIFVFFSNLYAADEWNIKKSTHFIVYYKDKLDDFADKTIDKAEGLYDDIADYLGFRRDNFWLWENRAKIYIYKDAEGFHKATGLAAWSGGYAKAEEKVIKTYPWQKGFFDAALPHEMTHIIFREFVGFDNPNIPTWLEEGIAGYKEKTRRFNAKRILKSAIINNNFIELGSLNRLNPNTINDPELVNIYYAETLSLIDYLISNFGKDDFSRFCRALRDKNKLDEALDLVYHFKNIEELNKAWQAYLKE